jgi:hypothetical protein
MQNVRQGQGCSVLPGDESASRRGNDCKIGLRRLGPESAQADFVIGDHSEKTCRRLWNKIPEAYKHCLTFSDFWQA